MDPLNAISLASSIVQFVDFSLELIRGAREIQTAGDVKENKTLEAVTSEMKRLSLTLSSSSNSPQSEDEKGLCRLAEECKVLSDQILQLLKKIQPKDPKSKYHSVRSALKNKLHQKEKADLDNRLDRCRSQLGLQLNFLMRFRCL